MNGFHYDLEQKKITITDNTTVVIWENVEKEIADEAGKMFGDSKSIDNYLHQNNCKRFRN
jgi:hypothetical protein